MATISEASRRIQMLREAKGITKKKAAEDLDMPYTTYCHYEDGSIEPRISALIKLALYYKISVDWIVGHDTEITKNPPPENKWETMEQALEKLSDNDLKEVWSFVKFLHWRKMNENH